MSATPPAKPTKPAQPTQPRVSPFFGDAGLLFAIAMLVNALVGAAIGGFGATTRAQAVQLESGVALAVDPLTSGAAFDNVAWFTVASLVLGAGLGTFAYRRLGRSRGPAMLLWVLAVGLFGAYVMLLVALGVGSIVHPTPNLNGFAVGDTTEIFPAMDTGVALVLEALLAVAAYWLGMFISGDDSENDATEDDKSGPIIMAPAVNPGLNQDQNSGHRNAQA